MDKLRWKMWNSSKIFKYLKGKENGKEMWYIYTNHLSKLTESILQALAKQGCTFIRGCAFMGIIWYEMKCCNMNTKKWNWPSQHTAKIPRHDLTKYGKIVIWFDFIWLDMWMASLIIFDYNYSNIFHLKSY